jgi:hypothetical protein
MEKLVRYSTLSYRIAIVHVLWRTIAQKPGTVRLWWQPPNTLPNGRHLAHHPVDATENIIQWMPSTLPSTSPSPSAQHIILASTFRYKGLDGPSGGGGFCSHLLLTHHPIEATQHTTPWKPPCPVGACLLARLSLAYTVTFTVFLGWCHTLLCSM